MGEYAEMMLDGTCCAGCGEYLGDGDGFAVYCSSCEPDYQFTRTHAKSEPKERPHPCVHCNRSFVTERGRATHCAAKHGHNLVPVLTAALQNLLNGIETGAITSDHDEVFTNAITKARKAIDQAQGKPTSTKEVSA